jgi:hypothetical protein
MSNLIKIVVFVPVSHTELVKKATGDAGAGRIGNYSHCSFTTKGKGNFKPLEGAHPFIGAVGKMEVVEEDKVEFVCPKDIAKEVIAAMKKVHPYEEVAFDIYPLISEEEL